ncbi:CaiB/BaiF CoA transferase family protein [Mycobacteroides abscessus]|uniref:CaiB/BaiF CoA transferase family protein n=1 Tax=Mycobacteroides abscessus TaxID=36809 RepID=UPI0009A7A258|nr:CoA transferase [Mycobacteroides abscessus]SKG96309.1 L-carnitine dehydratase/bile acid-inducible protein F [Mycobacteroides abscessus subsp. massiliense]SKH56432.1 L-carnitine dehydratase/bile acid-inducible protein F [Mycobacteroides abscessus subsp. massiliense]SKI08427.1 L-carnitine dehydratase/bile acid-inducible protein F [Mycobacteroides abscessus subsp. massiliense]SKJ39561.1 L-carnitine dehydratase/bile acid-inducible protein F [Mycobacteroides abscessus subsp. massiliense]SKJ82788
MKNFFSAGGARGGPLAGLRVVELSSVVMAPYACQLLGDMGADVVKVEPPGGEMARHYPGGRGAGMNPLFLNTNKNKRSIVCDLRDDNDRETFFSLVGEADVLVTNHRPSARLRLGVDYDSISPIFPRLIYCGAQGFRRESPEYDQAAYDEVVQSASGLTSAMEYLTGYPSCFPSIIADKICGLAIVNSVLAAVVARNTTGRGQEVNVPMVDTLFAFTMLEHLAGNTFVPPYGPAGYPFAFTVERGDVQAKNGKISIHPYSLGHMEKLLVAVGRQQLLENDPYFHDWGNSMNDGRKHLYETVRDIAPLLTVNEWMEVGRKHSIPMSVPLDIKSPLENPYVRAGALLREFEHSTEGTILVPKYPIYYSDTPIPDYHETPTIQNKQNLGS